MHKSPFLEHYIVAINDPARLDRLAFARALRHGRGAALLHAKAYGLEGLEDLVLQACLQNQAYDKQCEGHRAEWLFDMTRNESMRGDVRDALISELEHCDGEQITNLLGLMGKDGDENAANALRRFVHRQPDASEGVAGGRALITMDGVSAAADVCRRLGNFLLQNPDEYVDGLSFLAGEGQLFDDVLAELTRLMPHDAALAAYVAREQKRMSCERDEQNMTEEQRAARIAAWRADDRATYTLERIFVAATEGQQRLHLFRRFGHLATPAELELVLTRLANEQCPEACARLLSIFRLAPLPRFDQRVWELAQDRASPARQAALVALSHVIDPRVGALGRQIVNNPRFSADDAQAFKLLERNYAPGDQVLVLSALERVVTDDDGLHDLGQAALDFCGNQEVPWEPKIARWIYLTNPCTMCRRHALEQMLDHGPLDSDIEAECRFDASVDTHDLLNGSIPS